MHEKYIFCPTCKIKYPKNKIIFRCERCDGALEVIFDYNKMRKSINLDKLRKRPFNHARYLELYPTKKLVSLHSGGTPLIRSKNIEREQKLKFNLYFKYEAVNPTGSFKDRGSSVEIGRAVELGKNKIICASTGNMGASLAATSAVANVKCTVIVPDDAAPVKMEQILAYGAGVYQIKGSYDEAADMVDYAFKKHGIYLVGDYLHRREGTKSVGFEIAEQIKADYVVAPVGNGTLISAIWKAFSEFKTMGFIKKRPKMIAIQAEKCDPIKVAFVMKRKIKPVCGHTIAVAMECGDPLDGNKALNSIKESKGCAYNVSDKDIIKCREMLAEREGLFSEPAGAAALAGILKSKNNIEKGSNVVCLVTGHGLKTPYTGITSRPKKPGKTHKSVDSLF